METIVNFISQFSDTVKRSMEETKGCIGKQVIDSTAGMKGICIDRITDFSGKKISFLGVKYDKKELEGLEMIDEDVLVVKGQKEKFFIPMKDVSAVGGTVILLKSTLEVPEISPESVKTSDVFKRFNLTIDAIKDILPSVAMTRTEENKELNKKWISKLIGE